MPKIILEGMRFYAYHGFYEEEQIIGNEYVIDLEIDAGNVRGAKTDDLFQTLNYETIYRLVSMEMREPSKLIEHVGQRILDRVSGMFPKVKNVKVRLKKRMPAMRGRIDWAIVEFENASGGGGGSKGKGGGSDMDAMFKNFPKF